MNLPGATSGVYTDFEGLAKLRTQAVQDAGGAASEVAKQFEALFVQMLVKGLRDTTDGDPLLGRGAEMYQELFDQQISLELANSGTLGLAQVIERQLGDLTGAAGETPVPDTLDNLAAWFPAVRVRIPPSSETRAPMVQPLSLGDSPESFVRELLPHAQLAAERLGVDPKILVAQAALETGWGRHMIERHDGRPSFNFFGIKADRRWDGPRVEVSTLEYDEGVLVKTKAPFRAYESVAESFNDYATFIATNPRYHKAIHESRTPEDYIRALQSAGYATDPRYAEKIINVFRQSELNSLTGI